MCAPDAKLTESFFTKAMVKLRQEDVTASSKHLVFDLVHSFTPHLSLDSLTTLLGYLTPLLDVRSVVSYVYTCIYV